MFCIKNILCLTLFLGFLSLYETKVVAKIFMEPVTASEIKNETYLVKKTASIRRQVTHIEHQKQNKVEAFQLLINETEQLTQDFPDRAEPLIWNAISLSAQAKYKGMSALSNVKQAKILLEKAIEINPKASDAAAYNALAMLYYKVPAWPIAFGNNKKAEEYFQKAIATSSNLDTNYRYGEFLIEQGDKEEGVKYLQKALSFPNRPGRSEDILKKQDIQALIDAQKE